MHPGLSGTGNFCFFFV
uniref:Uncharacterized protein n=1 Tax=Rhizophora mucronata TaxID=61149 RepID=A0A2P2NLA5_RHIMU